MENLYANVIVDITHEKLDRTFQYKVPEQLREQLKAGSVVQIPFGRGGRSIKGYVIELTGQAVYDVAKLKEIEAVLTDTSPVESHLIALAAWMRDYYGGTMIQALKTVIPVKQRIKPREKKTVYLLAGPEEAAQKLAFCRKKNQKARVRLLEALIEEKELPMELVTGKLNISPASIKALAAEGLIETRARTIYRNPLKEKGPVDYRLSLNPEQQQIAAAIIGADGKDAPVVSLIHGITGSGKTEVYMEIIAAAISSGKQAIVLIPEIALTYQTVMRFYRRFGDRISIMNSRLSPGERYDQFVRARAGELDVMIGPRSALFTPFQNLGVIIIDEEHEESYKSETTPRYHARETALKRAELDQAQVVLGSATPSVEAYYKAQTGEYRLFELTKRAKESVLAEVAVVDMRDELQAGNRSVLSRELQSLMEERLTNREQIMLFINRRGYAGFLSCRACGKALQCPHCDVSLAVHRGGKMRCHYCGYETQRPQQCPQCDSPFLREFKAGTQQIESYLQKEFPGVKVLRMDMDTTREKDGHEKILAAFANHEADILVGTQMIVKGHDFPNVTLVAALAADMSLHVSDYKAAERTFQLLTQAAGRAGRGERPGKMIIQTYDPDNYSITAAAQQDYQGFYRQEILYRQVAGYPPAARLLAVHGAGLEEAYLGQAMAYLKKFIELLIRSSKVRVIGPADETVAKVNDIYRKVLYIKYQDEKFLTMIKNKVEQYIEANDGFNKIQIQFDMN